MKKKESVKKTTETLVINMKINNNISYKNESKLLHG